jgi:hypothetical protein
MSHVSGIMSAPAALTFLRVGVLPDAYFSGMQRQLNSRNLFAKRAILIAVCSDISFLK